MELNTRLTLAFDSDDISQDGVGAVYHWIYNKYQLWLPWNWDYRWVVERGPYQGKFPARVAKFLLENGRKLNDEDKMELGNIARQHSLRNTHFYFDFTDKFDWNAGDFGDTDACFFSFNRIALTVLRHYHSLAMRFYNADGRGIARAWMLPHADGWLLFNAYGSVGLENMARVAGQHLKVSYHGVYVCNRSNNGSVLYCNEGEGYFLTNTPKGEIPEELDFGHDLVFMCDICEAPVEPGEQTQERFGYYTCDVCAKTPTSHCTVCNRETFTSKLLGINGNEHWCNDCYYGCATCAFCQRTMPKGKYERHGWYTLCAECASHIRTCTRCGCNGHVLRGREVDGHWLCARCSGRAVQCMVCYENTGDTVQVANYEHGYNRLLCPVCAARLRVCECGGYTLQPGGKCYRCSSIFDIHTPV